MQVVGMLLWVSLDKRIPSFYKYILSIVIVLRILYCYTYRYVLSLKSSNIELGQQLNGRSCSYYVDLKSAAEKWTGKSKPKPYNLVLAIYLSST